MIIRGMSGMGKLPPRKCPAGQQLVSPGTKSERCVKVATILPPKPKPKPAPIVTAGFLATLPTLARPASSPAETPSSPAARPPSNKVLGLPVPVAACVGLGVVSLGWYLLRRRR